MMICLTHLENGGSGRSGGYFSKLVITNTQTDSNALANRYVAFDLEWYHEDTQEYLDGIDSDLAVLHSDA